MWLSTNAWARNRASRFGCFGSQQPLARIWVSSFHMWLSTNAWPETGLQVYHVLAHNNHWPESEFQVPYVFLNKPLARNRASRLGCADSQQPLARIWVSSFICGSQQTPGPETGLQVLHVFCEDAELKGSRLMTACPQQLSVLFRTPKPELEACFPMPSPEFSVLWLWLRGSATPAKACRRSRETERVGCTGT